MKQKYLISGMGLAAGLDDRSGLKSTDVLEPIPVEESRKKSSCSKTVVPAEIKPVVRERSRILEYVSIVFTGSVRTSYIELENGVKLHAGDSWGGRTIQTMSDRHVKYDDGSSDYLVRIYVGGS
ncbi:MAG: hypothetical protein V3V05_07485 [Pontiella sp.]